MRDGEELYKWVCTRGGTKKFQQWYGKVPAVVLWLLLVQVFLASANDVHTALGSAEALALEVVEGDRLR